MSEAASLDRSLQCAETEDKPVTTAHPKERPFNPIFWEKLTWLRGCLALYVLLHHVRNALWPLVRDLGDAGRLWKAWNSAIGVVFFFGLDAVLLFFLVSGLSIHAATLSKSTSSFSAPSFYRRRLRRLMPALVASFLPVGLVFYVYRGHSFHEQWSNLFGTLAFQQGIFTDSFAENSPYWSLANEGYYYLIYPLLWMTMRKIGNLPGLLLFGSLALVLCFAAPIRNAGTLAIFYPVWLAGVFLAVTLREGRKWTTVWLGIMVLVILASMATSLGERLHPRWNQPLWHTLSGVSLASVLYLWLRVIQVDRVSTRVRKALNTLGEISYSLYLTHFVVITAVATRWPHAKDSFLSAAASSLLAVAASLALGRALYRAVERPFLAS